MSHPASEPLTVKRIERVIEALQRSIQYQNGGDMAYVIADAIKGLEELLVSKEEASETVPDEELDQMIWKLERDGMTPKLLSLMRELLEVRRAKGEPVAVINGAREPVLYGEHIGIAIGTHLYAAPPAPVTPDGWNPVSKRMPENGDRVLVFIDFDSSSVPPLVKDAEYTGTTFRIGPNTVNTTGVPRVTHWMKLPPAPEQENI
ncbi:DUF551 domain-containing protein [Escherichia coli]|uniref:DUF551 domain-containing protein n=1 Tax=Escherichia coli TaxID=562 RepID=UPI0022466850|nr:DUF551 domain-containing protein [Escherichia coli]MCW9908936.1 DUF551 domain-containing protein [Escherichia coli]